jgi:hypothetical protein
MTKEKVKEITKKALVGRLIGAGIGVMIGVAYYAGRKAANKQAVNVERKVFTGKLVTEVDELPDEISAEEV